MATKCMFNGLPAYEEGCFVVQKSPDDGLWRIHHPRSGKTAMGQLEPFKQKRDSLKVVENLLSSGLDFSVNSYQELLDKNGTDRVVLGLEDALKIN